MRHVYLHVPFCRRRCSYCDFAIAVRRSVPARAFVAAVSDEIALRQFDGAQAAPAETVYLGGGTPSLLPSDALARLVDRFPRATHAEVTLEANPDDVTRHTVAAWRSLGVNRVSLGAQTFDDGALAWMHRTHDSAAISRAVQVLRDAGLTNVSLDLIFGLPSHLRRSWDRDLDGALALQPGHLSIYGLSVEPRTPLARWIARGRDRPGPEARYAREFLRAHDRLIGAGFEHYEVSNYAQPGKRSRHNTAYWDGSPYLGFGPSAHGFDGTRRRWNLREWSAYEAAIRSGADPVQGTETLSGSERRMERLFLGLRTGTGVRATDVPATAATALRRCLAEGLLARHGDRLRCTPGGWLVLDALVTRLTT